jgi:hypothetical protein
MSDHLDNMAEVQSEVTQPVGDVVSNAELDGSPQTVTEEMELFIEAEGDQTQEPNHASQSDAELHARWLKERDKRKKKEELRKAEEERANRLEAELAELRKTVIDVTRGSRPDPYDYGTTEEFYAALDEWNRKGTNQPSQTQEQQQEQKSSPVNDEDEFYLYQKEQEIAKSIPTYEQEKQGLIEQFKQFGGGEHNIPHLSSVARQKGLNIAKVIVGLNKNPSLVRRINDAYSTQNPYALADVLVEAQNKVRLQAKKPLGTQPEPTIQNGGRIDNKSAALENARKAWSQETDPNKQIKLWNEYQALKQSK